MLSTYSFITDENIQADAIVDYLNSRGVDVLTVRDAGLQQSSDAEILAFANSQSRVIITHDPDFGRLTIAQRQPFLGIVYLRPGHINSSFTIGTLRILLDRNPHVNPPFIIVAHRRGDVVNVRVRLLSE
jgi:predicted nuclease of predicted toxin-antitoxin system